MADPKGTRGKRPTVVESQPGTADSYVRAAELLKTSNVSILEISSVDAAAFLSMQGSTFLGLGYSGFDPNQIRTEAVGKLGYFTAIGIGILVAQNGTKKLREREVPVQAPDGSATNRSIGSLGLSSEKSIIGQQLERTTLTPSRIMHAFVYEVTIALSKMPNLFKRVGDSRIPAACQHAAVASLPWEEDAKGVVKDFSKTFSFLINQLREKDHEKSIRANFSEQIFEQQWASRNAVIVPTAIKDQVRLVCRLG